MGGRGKSGGGGGGTAAGKFGKGVSVAIKKGEAVFLRSHVAEYPGKAGKVVKIEKGPTTTLYHVRIPGVKQTQKLYKDEISTTL